MASLPAAFVCNKLEKEENVTYRVRFRPEPGIFAKGNNLLLLLDELRELGDCKIVAQTQRIPPLKDLNAEECYLYWDMILTTNRGVNAVKDVFIFVEDESDLTVDVVDEGSAGSDEADGLPDPAGDGATPLGCFHGADAFDAFVLEEDGAGDAEDEGVGLVGFEEAVDAEPEWGEAAFVNADGLVVEPDFGEEVDGVELEVNDLRLPGFRDGEGAAIEGDAFVVLFGEFPA